MDSFQSLVPSLLKLLKFARAQTRPGGRLTRGLNPGSTSKAWINWAGLDWQIAHFGPYMSPFMLALNLNISIWKGQ